MAKEIPNPLPHRNCEYCAFFQPAQGAWKPMCCRKPELIRRNADDKACIHFELVKSANL